MEGTPEKGIAEAADEPACVPVLAIVGAERCETLANIGTAS